MLKNNMYCSCKGPIFNTWHSHNKLQGHLMSLVSLNTCISVHKFTIRNTHTCTFFKIKHKEGKNERLSSSFQYSIFFSLCVPRSTVPTKIRDHRVVARDCLIGPVSRARVIGAFCSRRRQSDNLKCN